MIIFTPFPVRREDVPVSALRPYALRCDHRTTPLGIDDPAPLLSWRLASDRRDDDPTAYRIRVAERPEELAEDGRAWWDSGRIGDPAAIGAGYEGPALRPSTRYHWQVEVWSATRNAPAAASSWFETGPTLPAGTAEPAASPVWTASWITHDPDPIAVVDAPTEGERALDDHGLAPCPLLRRSFSHPTGPPLVSARLHVSARGLYEVRLNGTRVGDAELAPGWTDYTRRVQYQTYDVTALVAEGENVLAATVADGWWSGFVGFEPRRAGAHYGTFPQLFAELRLTRADGSVRTVATDGSWVTGTGAIRHADLLMGECHDRRHAVDGWDLPGFDDAGWSPALVTDAEHRSLVASVDEPVRAMAEIPPVSVTRVLPGTHIVDFGQNVAGRVRLRVGALAAGARVVVRHAEVLDDKQRLYTANLRTAAATDVLIGDGRGPVEFEPRFTYHGFRYAEISGLPELAAGDVVAVALHSDTPWAGAFDCSDPDIRRLHACVEWGQRSNFVSVPTDCPQRDERLGWLADAQVFLPTAALNADVAAFFTKWLRDVDDARTPDGGFTNVAPRLTGVADEGAPGWGDAGVIVPWHLYRTYGDRRFLSRALDGMRAWVALIHRRNPDLIWRHRVGPHFSDWLAPGTPTPREVVATAYFAHSTRLTALAAEALDRHDVAAEHHGLAAEIRSAFVARFVTAGTDGRVRVAGDTQTGYLLALAFELLPGQLRDGAARRLAELVEAAGPALQTGFLGVALAAPVLDAHGRADLAHALLRRTEVPSWLFPLQHGATTIWERWDGWTPDGGFRAPAMNSFNHYALGSIGEWLHRGVAGLDQSEGSVAYRRLRVRPRPGALTHASTRYESARGTVAAGWERRGDTLSLRVQVPPGATADVFVPTTDPGSVRALGAAPDDGDHATLIGTGPDHAHYQVASGAYHFTAAFAPAAPSPAGPHEEDTP
ncbi:alpha-L-rhamnosidase [Actinacidiphila yanglinensis]|uniref:alpha-L-rhamnosidase n=1 Tax=Actinacidiphila yanglinensis TaxID=310779 RepID=A0A1H6DZT5_9ACTN|nr:alpha-L-rhamnosidase [Actinacidiphila yanglinensis]SEG90848.1 alpha-L-rhamnosidase [Actinacidiphila yanglinensis]